MVRNQDPMFENLSLGQRFGLLILLRGCPRPLVLLSLPPDAPTQSCTLARPNGLKEMTCEGHRTEWARVSAVLQTDSEGSPSPFSQRGKSVLFVIDSFPCLMFSNMGICPQHLDFSLHLAQIKTPGFHSTANTFAPFQIDRACVLSLVGPQQFSSCPHACQKTGFRKSIQAFVFTVSRGGASPVT